MGQRSSVGGSSGGSSSGGGATTSGGIVVARPPSTRRYSRASGKFNSLNEKNCLDVVLKWIITLKLCSSVESYFVQAKKKKPTRANQHTYVHTHHHNNN
jgi:hypothetical protein